MNKKKKLYLKMLLAIRRWLPLEIDPEAHGMGWAGHPCPFIRIDMEPGRDHSSGRRTGGQSCHS